MESSGKRVRAAGGGDTASAEAPDRVTLHVGGETFVTCRAILEPASLPILRVASVQSGRLVCQVMIASWTATQTRSGSCCPSCAAGT